MSIWCVFDGYLMRIWCVFDEYLMSVWEIFAAYLISNWSGIWWVFDEYLILILSELLPRFSCTVPIISYFWSNFYFFVQQYVLESIFLPLQVDFGPLRINFGPLEVDFWSVERELGLSSSPILSLWESMLSISQSSGGPEESLLELWVSISGLWESILGHWE